VAPAHGHLVWVRHEEHTGPSCSPDTDRGQVLIGAGAAMIPAGALVLAISVDMNDNYRLSYQVSARSSSRCTSRDGCASAPVRCWHAHQVTSCRSSQSPRRSDSSRTARVQCTRSIQYGYDERHASRWKISGFVPMSSLCTVPNGLSSRFHPSRPQTASRLHVLSPPRCWRSVRARRRLEPLVAALEARPGRSSQRGCDGSVDRALTNPACELLDDPGRRD
jgi:hypothetical protein